jgi:hypothetical protein
MNDNLWYFVGFPLLCSVALVWLRRSSSSAWGIAFVAVLLANLALSWKYFSNVQAVRLHLIPVVIIHGVCGPLAMFIGLRLEDFEYRPLFVIPGGVIFFWVGTFVAPFILNQLGVAGFR